VELINPLTDLPPLGLGEATGGPTVAAIGNAVARALGARIRELPMTRERVMAAYKGEFADCVPEELVASMLRARLSDSASVVATLNRQLTVVSSYDSAFLNN